MYFKKIPKILYKDISNTNQLRLVTDILRRVKIRSQAFDQLSMFDLYDVPSGETPEITAFKHFGSTQYHWVILLTNNITNVYNQWPLSEPAFSEYLLDKYEDNVDGVHHYEITQTSGDTTTRIQVASDTAGATPVTNREYEERLQDERRKVRLLSRSLLPNFIEEYERLIKA